MRETERESHLEVSGSNPAGREESLADFILFLGFVCFGLFELPRSAEEVGLATACVARARGTTFFSRA